MDSLLSVWLSGLGFPNMRIRLRTDSLRYWISDYRTLPLLPSLGKFVRLVKDKIRALCRQGSQVCAIAYYANRLGEDIEKGADIFCGNF